MIDWIAGLSSINYRLSSIPNDAGKIKRQGIFASYVVPGFDINRTFYEISGKDFRGTLSQAESFSDRYLRTLAVLAVVKDCEKGLKPVKAKTR